MKNRKQSEAGAILIALAMFILLLLCFVAFGTEAGRWFLIRAELSKSVDAGALVGAKNLSNPHVDPKTLAEEFCQENFPSGYLGTATTGSAAFNVQMLPNDKVQVDGRVGAPVILGQLLGVDDVPVRSGGAAQMRPVEVMMVLDRSGSMQGQPMTDLKVAAKSFLDFFAESQDKDKMGLVSFATSVKIERPLGTGFVTPMQTAIDAMVANGHTNPEDAIDQSDGPGGFTDQAGTPAGEKIQQFMVFFSDGRPNTFRAMFKRNGIDHEAMVYCDGNCDPQDFANGNNTTNVWLYRTDAEGRLRYNGVDQRARPTGDGMFPISACGAATPTTKWYIFERYPVPGYGPQACNIPDPALGDYMCNMAAGFAIDHANELKDKGVVVFAIGLGERINRDFLEAIASGPDQTYIAPTSDQLASVFQQVAREIKLRLVQ